MNIVTQIAEALHLKQSKPSEKPGHSPGSSMQRAPYSFNIGLDFGTAFSKCILRDTRLIPSRAAVVDFQRAGESTLLVPSEIYCNGDLLTTPLLAPEHNSFHTVRFLKMALYATLRGHRTDPSLLAIAQQWPDDDEVELFRKVESLVVFYLASLLRACFLELKKRRPDFNVENGDSLSVNMAVPAAHAQDTAVEEAFLRCLNLAWQFANVGTTASMSIQECGEAIRKIKSTNGDHACFIYPEVSANVQSFIKSPAGFPGLFLFVDVGAGTVDASTFIYYPHPSNLKPLSYFAAEVLPLGSSQYETRAVATVGDELFTRFRRCKERALSTEQMNIDLGNVLRRVGATLKGEVRDGIMQSLARAREKLTRPGQRSLQWDRLRILMGGGGANDPLYKDASQSAFAPWHLQPELLPLPLPTDLDWPRGVETSTELFRRFAVAYGLSFDRAVLEEHRYPDETCKLPVIEDEPIKRPSAPTKEDI